MCVCVCMCACVCVCVCVDACVCDPTLSGLVCLVIQCSVLMVSEYLQFRSHPTNVHLEGVVNAEEGGNRRGRSRREEEVGGREEGVGGRKERGREE